jgi:hypothetical protein
LENVSNFTEQLNIDDLYEKKQQHDTNKLILFNKILNRIHVKIRTTSRQKTDEQFCWFLVPEVIIGVPKYDQASCIAYLMDKLKENGFNIKYIHPNMLFISWIHWVPSYVRNELKKKTGIIVNHYGVRQNDVEQPLVIKQDLIETKKTKNEKTDYTPIKSYKPSGNFLYDDDLLNKTEDKLS